MHRHILGLLKIVPDIKKKLEKKVFSKKKTRRGYLCTPRVFESRRFYLFPALILGMRNFENKIAQKKGKKKNKQKKI